MLRAVYASWLPIAFLLAAANVSFAETCEPPAHFLSIPAETSLQAAVRQLAEVFGYRLVTDPELLTGGEAKAGEGCGDLAFWADHLLGERPLAYRLVGGDTLVVFRRPEPPPALADEPLEVPAPGFESEVLVVGQHRVPVHQQSLTTHYSQAPDLVVEHRDMVRMGITDLASALELASGVKMEQDRYMVIRGMKGRYQSVRINGGVIPGLGPSHQSLPMDIFPMGILNHVNLHKSVQADSPGGATAGMVNMETLRIPERDFFSVTAGGGYRQGTTGQTVIRSRDDDRNSLGFRDGTRDLPEILRTSATSGGVDGLTPVQQEAAGEAIPRQWGLYRGTAGADTLLNISGGKSWEGENFSWGITGAAGHRNEWEKRDLNAQLFERLVEDERTRIYPARIYEQERVENQIDQNLLLATGLSFRDSQHLGANLLWLRQGTDYAEHIQTTGVDSQGRALDWYQQRNLFHWTELELRLQQLYGMHQFDGPDDPTLYWQVSSAETDFHRPYDVNYRYTRRGTDSAQLGLGFDQMGVAWRSMAEDTFNASSQLVVPVGSARLDGEFKAGCERYTSVREGSNLEYAFEAVGDITADRQLVEKPNPSDIFTPENLVGDRTEPGFILVDRVADPEQDTGLQGRFYRAERENHACFLLADLMLLDRWTLMPGLRGERNAVHADLWDYQAEQPRELQEDSRLLPSFSLGYALAQRQTLRADYSRTVVWPGVSELLPIDYEEIDTRVTVRGNPALQPSDAENLDMQWTYRNREAGLNLKGLLFYKKIDDAIEGVFADSSEPGFVFNSYTFTNADAESYGYEFEADYELTLGGGRELTLSGSYARIHSRVDTTYRMNADSPAGEKRPLQGQPDYIASLGIRYERADGADRFSLLFKRSGRELYIVSDTPGVPPVYQQPENDLYLAYNRRVLGKTYVTLAVDNLLNGARHYTQGDATYLDYRPGRVWRLSFTLDM